jgi:hypothetical protein
MCPERITPPKIDVEKLKQTTAAALAAQDAAKTQRDKGAAAKKKIDDDRLFASITESLPAKMAEAASRGENTIKIWEMGRFEIYNPDYDISDIPINWELFNRLRKYCSKNKLITKIEKISLNKNNTEYISHRLIVSWPIK